MKLMTGKSRLKCGQVLQAVRLAAPSSAGHLNLIAAHGGRKDGGLGARGLTGMKLK